MPVGRIVEKRAHRLAEPTMCAISPHTFTKSDPSDRALDANGFQSGVRHIDEIFPAVHRKAYDPGIVGCDLSDADG
jgi:hypothetical protein